MATTDVIEVVARPPIVNTITARLPPEVVTVEGIRQGPPGRDGKSTTVTLARYNFLTPRKDWSVSHNKDSTFVRVDFFDSNGMMFLANYTVSDTTIGILLSSPMAGYILVTFGKAEDVDVITYE
jgi:hypothetical protein